MMALGSLWCSDDYPERLRVFSDLFYMVRILEWQIFCWRLEFSEVLNCALIARHGTVPGP